MKMLPDNPSLGHLHQQAKDLLAELRVSNPSAKLSHAQLALAEQYGFHRWHDLKAEVDRRRATLQPAELAVAHALASAFGLGDVTHAMLPVGRGALARTWSIATTRGDWFAVELYDWVSATAVDAGAVLLEAAAAAGVGVPMVARSATGAVVESAGGRRWRVYAAMSLGPSPVKPVGTAVSGRVGGALAKLHRLALPAAGPVGPWLTGRPPAARWRQLLVSAQQQRVPWLPMLEDALPTLLDVGSVGIPVEGEQQDTILCHSNLTPSSVRTNRRGDLVIVGWEAAGALPPRWELGYVVLQWGTDARGDINERALRALGEAYVAEGGTLGRIDERMFATAIAAALNWTAGRVERALQADGSEDHALAVNELPELLVHPISRGRIEDLVEVMSNARSRMAVS